MAEGRRHDWVWFFAVLVALGTAAVVIPVVYNLGLQLTPEQVAEARARWRASGPADYDLDYQQKYSHDGGTDETAYRVLVRGRRVVAAGCDGRLTLLADPAAALAAGPGLRALPGLCGTRDVDGMFDHIERQLRADAGLPRRPYATATFDKRDGHPARYVRRTRGGAERLEWTVKLTRAGSADATMVDRPH
jgi:hypothetical protein